MVTVCRDSGLGAGRKVQFGVHHLFSKYLLKTFCRLGSVPGNMADQMNKVRKGRCWPCWKWGQEAQWWSHSEGPHGWRKQLPVEGITSKCSWLLQTALRWVWLGSSWSRRREKKKQHSVIGQQCYCSALRLSVLWWTWADWHNSICSLRRLFSLPCWEWTLVSSIEIRWSGERVLQSLR